MSFQPATNDTLKSVVEIFASASKDEQRRMLRVLRYEKARLLARKLDKMKPRVQRSDRQITEAIHRIRKSYGRK